MKEGDEFNKHDRSFLFRSEVERDIMGQLIRQPAAMLRATYHSFQQESELVVAILRTALIVLAAFTPVAGGSLFSSRYAMQISIAVASLYNAVIFLLYWRRIRLRGQRLIMVISDILLVSTWVYLTWNTGPGGYGSPLTPFFNIIILVSALWFGVSGALGSASIISTLFLVMAYRVSDGDPFAVIDALYRDVTYFFLLSIMAGYLVDTHKREREQWTRSQVLLAQYQERFRAAQEVYELLIPSQAPKVAGLDLAARWRPALQEGGGDFYDVVAPTPSRVVLTIADVSGKHSRGAMKLPIFKAAFQATSQVWESPGDVLEQVNHIVYPLLQPDMFISACVIVIDIAQRRLVYANAGQDPPVFVRAQTRDTVTLESGGLLLGIDFDATYPTEELMLEPGDTICLYTDGITEARNLRAEEFGIDTLTARVQSAVAIGLTAEETANNIFEAVNQHVSGEARHDDMTLLVVRFNPEA